MLFRPVSGRGSSSQETLGAAAEFTHRMSSDPALDRPVMSLDLSPGPAGHRTEVLRQRPPEEGGSARGVETPKGTLHVTNARFVAEPGEVVTPPQLADRFDSRKIPRTPWIFPAQ